MKDDFFKTLETILSGSIKVKEREASDHLKKDLNEEELINSFMNQILDCTWLEDDLKKSCLPSYRLCDKKDAYWLMNDQLKILIHVKSGVEVIPITTGESSTVCLIGQSTFNIPNEILICSGWN